MFITPKELCSAIESAIVGPRPKIYKEVWKLGSNKLIAVDQPLSQELGDKHSWRFYVGYGPFQYPTVDGSPWNFGFIQFDNPNWSEDVLCQVHIVIKRHYDDSKEFELTSQLYERLVKRVKSISSRGRHLELIATGGHDNRNWLSEGALEWMKMGKVVTDSIGPGGPNDVPHVIHSLVKSPAN